MTRSTLILLCLALMTGCKIQLSSSAGGRIDTLSGEFTCAPDQACVNIDVSDVAFDETFVAVPDDGFEFIGWRRRAGGLCGGTTDNCRIFTSVFAGNDVLIGLLSSDQQLYLEAVFAREGGLELTGDDARRAVLADIGERIILPSIREFESRALAMQAAASSAAAAPNDSAARAALQQSWRDAMAAWQRNEVLQVGPAGRSTNPDAVPGGQNFRDLIYSWPFTLNVCSLEAAAENGDAVTGATPINIIGLGALEHLLFTDAAAEQCNASPGAAARASHAARLADRVALLATALRDRWEPEEDNFLAQWSTAGLDTSVIFSRPQEAFDSLSIALFYVEKSSKDRKVALPTGIPVSGLECSSPVACPEFLESPLSASTGANLLANVQAFRDVFTGVDGGFGINDLLIAIERSDLADELIEALDVVIADMEEIEAGEGFDQAVRDIDNATDCVNASANSSGVPACEFHGKIKAAMDIFRAPIVAALGLAIPSSAAGDND